MSYEIQYSCISHIGNVRKNNQDNYICDGHYIEDSKIQASCSVYGKVKIKNHKIFGVFDGMGGEECGEVASCIAAKQALSLPIRKNDICLMNEYCEKTNQKICDYTKQHSISSMGTTAAMLLFSRRIITLCNIGDSKIYRFSNGKLEQISKDHISISAYGTKPPLSQNLGIPSNVLKIEPYLSQSRYKNGDKYLICSDGLTDSLNKQKIQEILLAYSTEEATTCLVNSALQNFSKDNITVLLIEINRYKNKILKHLTNKLGV